MRDLDPIMLEERINKLEKGGDIEHLTEVVESIDNSLITGTEHFYFDKKDGVYGYNTDEERGADTFHPFSMGGDTFEFLGLYPTVSTTYGAFILTNISNKISYDFKYTARNEMRLFGTNNLDIEHIPVSAGGDYVELFSGINNIFNVRDIDTSLYKYLVVLVRLDSVVSTFNNIVIE